MPQNRVFRGTAQPLGPAMELAAQFLTVSGVRFSNLFHECLEAKRRELFLGKGKHLLAHSSSSMKKGTVCGWNCHDAESWLIWHLPLPREGHP